MGGGGSMGLIPFWSGQSMNCSFSHVRVCFTRDSAWSRVMKLKRSTDADGQELLLDKHRRKDALASVTIERYNMTDIGVTRYSTAVTRAHHTKLLKAAERGTTHRLWSATLWIFCQTLCFNTREKHWDTAACRTDGRASDLRSQTQQWSSIWHLYEFLWLLYDDSSLFWRVTVVWFGFRASERHRAVWKPSFLSAKRKTEALSREALWCFTSRLQVRFRCDTPARKTI